VCNLGRNRSKTAAELMQGKHEAKFAGIYSMSSPISLTLLEWADKIFVMEDRQLDVMKKRFPYIRKEIINLEIPNTYYYNQGDLKEIIKEKLADYV
jgi:predicted protein tyrosine phosphatase